MTGAGRARVLILGGTGTLGHTLFECLSDRPELDVHATARDSAPLQARVPPERRNAIHPDVDASHLETIGGVISAVRPDMVVNAIGIVKQVPAGRDPVACLEINALLPHRLSRICSDAGVRLVHLSTDCVFSGSRGSYTEVDPPDPADLYGRSKLLGETEEREGGALTLRTSIVGHELATRHGLVEWLLAQDRTAPGFRRAIFSGLPTVEVARVLAEFVLPHPELSGVYHLSSEPISKLELLELIASRYHRGIEIVPRDDPAMDRSLDSSRFRTATGYRPPAWPQLVDTMFEDATRRYPARFSAVAGRGSGGPRPS